MIETPTADSTADHQTPGSMMDSSESPREAGALTADALKPKSITRVGFWNVRTLNQSGKLAQATKEFDFYNLYMLGMSEVRRKSCDRRQLAPGWTPLSIFRKEQSL